MTVKKAGLFVTDGWDHPMMFFSFYCEEHGQVINYCSGHTHQLSCPICLWERRTGKKWIVNLSKSQRISKMVHGFLNWLGNLVF